MLRIFLILLALTALPARAQVDEAPGFAPVEAGSHELSEYLWTARPVVVFADNPSDPRFVRQMEYLAEDPAQLAERQVVVITDTDPAVQSPIREALRPRGFDLVVIGKDGFKYLRKPTPWTLREIVRSIDKMPIRQQELTEMRGMQ